MNSAIKVLLAKLGLDSHWRGIMTVARALRDAGFEVIFIGNQLPQAIVTAALQENANVIGLSSLSGNHLALAPKVVQLLNEQGVDDVPVILGGTVPPNDIAELKRAGIHEVFPPGTSLQCIIDFVRENASTS